MRRMYERIGIVLLGTGLALILYLTMPFFILLVAAVILIAAGSYILR